MKYTQTRAKIICTIGPSCDTYEKIVQLIDAGMNVARLNFSHGTHDDHRRVISILKQAREAKNISLAIMLDTKGPEIRVGKMAQGAVSLIAGQRLLLVDKEILGDQQQVQITPTQVMEPLCLGAKILFDDGYMSSTVVERNDQGVVVKIDNEGILKTHKGVNIPGVDIPLPAMTEQDIADIQLGCELDVDIIAASFIRSAEHILEIKQLLSELNQPDILVIAKIENSLGVHNFDQIIRVADGIMVARGDLGVELPLKQVPKLQKMMIRKCYQAAKPVITATQMLESMIKNPRPTRAEVSDVANAIYDSTSAVMLSGETAIGQYPIESVQMMQSIVHETEKDFNYRHFAFKEEGHANFCDVSISVSLATVKTAYNSGARAIFVFTSKGFTSRLVSSFRPEMPIVVLTPYLKIYHQLSLNWGVVPVEPSSADNVEDAFSIVSRFALKTGIVGEGDLVVVTAGSPFGVSGTTNMMLVESIGNVVVRGLPGDGVTIKGAVRLMHTSDSNLKNIPCGYIVVITRCDPSYFAALHEAIGIILQNQVDDLYSERYATQIALEKNIPLLVRAEGAMHILKEGQIIILDPQKGVVYALTT